MKQSDIEGIGKYAEELGEHLQAVERTLEAYSTTGGLFCWIKAASNGETAGQSFKLPEAIKVAIALRIPTNETAVQIEDALRRADANRKYRELSEMVEWLEREPQARDHRVRDQHGRHRQKVGLGGTRRDVSRAKRRTTNPRGAAGPNMATGASERGTG